MYARIVVPLDGSPFAEQVLPHVAALARAFGATVTLLQAVPAPGPVIADAGGTLPVGVPGSAVVDPAPLIEAAQEAAATYLKEVADRLHAQGIRVESAQPVGGAADAIVDQARTPDADLIAMTTHGRGGLQRLVYGSVADAVLRHAPCPVLLVRVGEA